MPEVHFTIQLPDGTQKTCYSPSSVVLQHFRPQQELTIAEFVRESRIALTEASERVQRKFGFSCTAAAAQLEEIELFSQPFPPDDPVRILSV
jgi:hypothetical protein